MRERHSLAPRGILITFLCAPRPQLKGDRSAIVLSRVLSSLLYFLLSTPRNHPIIIFCCLVNGQSFIPSRQGASFFLSLSLSLYRIISRWREQWENMESNGLIFLESKNNNTIDILIGRILIGFQFYHVLVENIITKVIITIRYAIRIDQKKTRNYQMVDYETRSPVKIHE